MEKKERERKRECQDEELRANVSLAKLMLASTSSQLLSLTGKRFGFLRVGHSVAISYSPHSLPPPPPLYPMRVHVFYLSSAVASTSLTLECFLVCVGLSTFAFVDLTQESRVPISITGPVNLTEIN